MKTYNSISHWNKFDGIGNTNCIAFDKLDGSNVRFEWNKNKGFFKYGTRTQMISEKDETFGKAISIFMEKYSEDLSRIFTDNREYINCKSYVVFGEYFGFNSFAGRHEKEDKKDVIIFDISKYKHGLIDAKSFIKDFGHLDIPNIIYEGILDENFINKVRNNDYNLKEGIVAKGTEFRKGKYYPWMIKVKTNQWLEKVKNKFGEKALLEEVNGDFSILENVTNRSKT